MGTKKLYMLVAGAGLTAALGVGLFFGLGSIGDGDSSGSEVVLSVAAEDAEEASDPGDTPTSRAGAVARSSSGGPIESIQVHGHWTIEVRNPDGSLVSRTEFDNALHVEGAASLRLFLSRTSAVGLWTVVVDGGPDQPCTAKTQQSACRLVEENDSRSGSDVSHTLVVGDQPNGITLSGHTFAARESNISSVLTQVARCPLSKGTGCLELPETFTKSSVDPPINVVPQQQILVTVNLNFS